MTADIEATIAEYPLIGEGNVEETEWVETHDKQGEFCTYCDRVITDERQQVRMWDGSEEFSHTIESDECATPGGAA